MVDAAVYSCIVVLESCHADSAAAKSVPNGILAPNGRSEIAPTNIYERDSEPVGAVIDRPKTMQNRKDGDSSLTS